MKHPVDSTELPWEVFYEGTNRELRGKALSDVGGLARVGVGLMQLAPGCDTKPAHYHSREEEHLFALKGTATLELDGRSFQLVSGSYVCFPAAQAASHYLHNTGKEPFWYLMIGQRDDEDEVTYPSESTP